MNIETVVQAATAIAAPAAAIAGLSSRKRRLRAEIRDNLALAGELDQNNILREHTPVSVWMHGRIALDVARLTGQSLGTPKKPIPKTSVFFTSVFVIMFAGWTYLLNRDGFIWYSIFPALAAFLLAVSVFGMLLNRQLPPEQSHLPPGATPIRTDSASERITTSVALATEPGAGDRFSEWGQAGVVLRFFKLMREGHFEEGIELADSNWLYCRVQSWLYNNRNTFGSDETVLDHLAASLSASREPTEVWQGFVATESEQFRQEWGSIDPAKLGVASRERRIAVNFARVIVTSIGDTGGYFVTSATILPDALTFVVRLDGGRWLIASHFGTAPPMPGWPPAWWSADDPAVAAAVAAAAPENAETGQSKDSEEEPGG
ncbi:hypothetical protein ACIBMZ_05820 [Micromonospora sp. NPDC049900]|uniref:hypothetical protein n=1 Tax=Micromonospora sp. NPDC049900 TaxID=3364275 RepID=UPI00379B03BE